MSYQVQKKLPPASQVLADLPLPDGIAEKVQKDQSEVQDILAGRDDRLLMIIGPCSAWKAENVIAYAQQLKPVTEAIKDKVKIVFRCYIQKPRTTVGWMGPLNQPDPYKEPDLEAGIYYCREMMIELLKLGYPLADEALFTHNDSYFVDLLSWIAIGARSCEDQEHRIFASMIPHPAGIKNPTSGNIRIGVNSIIASQYSHTFAFHGEQIKTSGNPYAHLLLRGGSKKPNCSCEELEKSVKIIHEAKVQNPAIIVDASHDNSMRNGSKDPLVQPEVVFDVLECMKKNEAIGQTIKGFMVESFLEDGKQNMNNFTSAEELKPGLSITDGCLGIEKTIGFLKDLHERL
mgnify:CR=1 FL=1